jgi:DNA-binding CsgD family transcriptional regulator
LLSIPQALASGDPTKALMARALVWLMRFVPSAVGLFYTVDPRLQKFSSGLIVANRRSPGAPDLEPAMTRYRQLYHALDPLAPRRFASSTSTVVDLAELTGDHGRELSPYVSEYLRGLGVDGQTTLHLRANGRIVAGVDLLRAAHTPPITAQQLSFLRTSHPLLEQAYACAIDGLAASKPVDVVAGARLTRRETEVANLVSSGASNAEIARALAISEATVKSHLMRVFEKLNIRSRTQLAVMFTAERPPDLETAGPMPAAVAELHE